MADDFAASTNTSGRLAIGKDSTGNIDSANDVDWFRITLAAGQLVRLDLTGNPGAARPLADPYLAGVYSAAGVLLPDTSDDDSGGGVDAQVMFKAVAAGDYYVAVGASGPITGAYLLRATDQTPPPPALTIEAFADVQPEGDQGSTLMRFIVTRDGDLDAASSARWSVQASGATPAGAADFGAAALPSGTVSFLPGQDSATIEISVPGDTVHEHDASFSVALSAPVGATLGGLDGAAAIDVAVRAAYGVTEQFYRLTGNGGQFSITSAANSEPLAVAIYVNGALATDSAAAGAYKGSLAIPAGLALRAGDVIAVVTTGRAGQDSFDYAVNYLPGVERAAYIASMVIVDDDPAPDDYPGGPAGAGALAIGSALSGSIEKVGDADWFAVSLVAGQSYAFMLDAAASHGLADPLLELHGADGELIASDDDDGPGLAAQLNVRVPASGVYYLAARGSNDATGNYRLYGAFDSVRADDFAASTATTGSIRIGASAGGRVETAGDQDWFAVSLNASTAYQFRIKPADIDGLVQPALALYGSASAPLAQADASGKLTFTPAAGGTYYLSASGPAGAIGNYSIGAAGAAADVPDTTAPVLTASTPARGASGVAGDASIKLVFSEAMTRAAGAIEIRSADGTLIESLDAATSSRIAIDGNTITIDPATTLAGNGGYRLSVGAGAFTDLAGNPVKGGASVEFSTASPGAPAAGSAANDLLYGGSGNDTLAGSGGNDVIDGGAGFDQLRYAGKRADYAFAAAAAGALLVTKPGGAGTDSVAHVERLRFDDGALALDLDGVAGQAYRLYQAVLDRVPEPDGVGFWIAAMDKGLSLRGAAAFFVASPEFQQKYGAALTDAQLVDRLYQNVLHRAAEPAGFDFWVKLLESHAYTAADLVMSFSESPENQAALIGVMAAGISYTPYG